MSLDYNSYDLIVVGAGLYGATLARFAHDKGRRVLVLERRTHVAGNCYDEVLDDIIVHRYGAHIFYTGNEKVWNFVNRFANFNNYIHEVVTRYGGVAYTLPFNLNTLEQVYGITDLTSCEAEQILQREREKEFYCNPVNLEQQAINSVGRPLYLKLIKGYTEKQWETAATQLSPDIIKRIPVRFNRDNRYFSDIWQGIPVGGYTRMIKNMLEGIEIRTNVDFKENMGQWYDMATQIVYTGMVDELLDWKYGALPYRSLRFENDFLQIAKFQNYAVVNEADESVPYTRIIEHKHFMCLPAMAVDRTIITREYPVTWKIGLDAYYPIVNAHSMQLYKQYCNEIEMGHPKIRLGGRLGLFRYMDMDDTVADAIATGNSLFANTNNR